MTFSTNFFIVYIFSLIIFLPELKIFYYNTWTHQIQKSSFIWHVLRFSSGVPFFIFEGFLASEFALNGLTLIKFQGFSWQKGAFYDTLLPRGTTQKRWAYACIIQTPSLVKPISSLVFETAKPKPFFFNLTKKHVEALKNSELLSNSELSNLHGRELTQSILLKRVLKENPLLMPGDFAFLNESTFLIHPELTWNKNPYMISVEFCLPREKGFSFAAQDLNGDWYFFTKINEHDVHYVQLEENDLNVFLNFIVSDDLAWTDLSNSNGVLLTKAIQFKTHDLVKIDSNKLVPDFIIEEKAHYQRESRPSYGNSTNAIKLSYLDTRRGQLDLFDNLQGSKFLGSSNLHKEPIIPKKIKQLVEERAFLKHDFLKDHERATKFKVQVFTKIVKNYLETIKSK